MKIFIKSFNRPYYLHRCIASLYRFLNENSPDITVLDDGTPAKYLERIKLLFPKVQILTSPYYQEKTAYIEAHLKSGVPIPKLKIPAQFWLQSVVQSGGPWFLMMEDDMWLVAPIDEKTVTTLMEQEGCDMLKLCTFGNPLLKSGTLSPWLAPFSKIDPEVFTWSPFWHEHIFDRNTFRIGGVLRRLRVIHRLEHVRYYTFYVVAGGVFQTSYFRSAWDNFEGYVDENRQIYNVLKHLKSRDTPIKIAMANKDLVQTSFSTSATNTFPSCPLDIFTFNHIMNEAWYEGKIDPSLGMPADYPADMILHLLAGANNKNASQEDWLQYRRLFISNYRGVGFKLTDEGAVALGGA